MIRLTPGLPPGVVGFEAAGTVTAEEYRDVLDPAFDVAADAADKLRILAVLGPDFDGFEGGAMFEDAAAGLRHWSRWQRIAIVTDEGSVGTAVHWLGWLVPGDVRVFDPAQLAEARAWILGS